ncbi:MAG: NAD(P)H-dependent oxidoreductase [Candidatus Marsarchaeota archaeon]|nr:NAD(P)H-dependent oxidoreductase [Candidatus Marsarchaeota archaeon]
MTIKIIGFGGSFRKESFSKVLLKEAQKLAPKNTEIEVFDRFNEIPLFNQDNESNPPAVVKEFKDKIKKSDAVLIVTPEYNYSIPGFIKNAIDWASRPYGDNSFEEKPLAIISCSTGMLGGSRAQYHLRQALVFLNTHPLNKPEVMIPFVDKKIKDGALTDKDTADRIANMLEELVKWSERIKKTV